MSFELVAPYTVKVEFEDRTTQAIDFRPILEGELFGPLRETSLFNHVQIDSVAHTLVWPNGADFDPEDLQWTAQSLACQQWLAPSGQAERESAQTWIT